MRFGGGPGIEARNLIIIEDQLRLHAQAAKKCELYAASFADPALKSCASQLANHHRECFLSLMNYLDAHR
jgi:hypothetical protein